MKRAHYTYGLDRSGKHYWRSLGELAASPEFEEALAREFPEGASELADGFSRRQFLKLMGASAGLAGLAACRRPEEKILPYARAPEHLVPGRPQYYATAMPWMGTALGLLVESHEGRPTKVEGNPRHPESLGGSPAFAQASILDLYDPDRSSGPQQKGMARTWDEAAAFLKARGDALEPKGGAGLAILSEGHRSPTLQALLAELSRAMPAAKVYRYEPFARDAVREGARIAFGRSLEPVLEVGRAKVIVALDSDFLFTEGSPVRQARGFGDGRQLDKPSDAMNRLYAVESAFTVTGASADHRLRIRRSEVPLYLLALAKELGALGVDLTPELAAAVASSRSERFENPKNWVKAVAKDLVAHRGAGLLVAGEAQPAVVHALCALLNERLGNLGQTVRYVKPFDEAPEGPGSIAPLARAMARGEVDTLLVLGGNPAFAAPADAGFSSALAHVPHALHLSTHLDETGEKCEWHLNRAHLFESWGDARTADGTASIVQPLIAPLFGGKTDAEVVSMLLGVPRKAYDLVRETWRAALGGPDFEHGFRRALHDGLLSGSAFPNEQGLATAPARIAAAVKATPSPADGLELTFHPDAHAFDGRFANNGWLQELPDPLTLLTWDNAALISPATCTRLGVVEGDQVELALDGRKALLPVLTAPGQADGSIALSVGQGRTRCGTVGQGVGFDVNPLRASSAMAAAIGASLKKTGVTLKLARTQEHSAMEGRPLVREATLERYREDPEFAEKMVEHPPLKSLFPDQPYTGHRWGMVVDLNRCIGCGACTLACQAENNIPLVGKSGVLRSREMHWFRVDRYFEGAPAEPTAVFQPIGCQQCENAPCEQVCPVGATTHSPEGLNDMAYNRCVGTRYCANNCPFKVRRFNFFNYTKDMPELRKMLQNPDVTVRTRGVMEKCTYCVQRIQEAKIAAHKEGREKVRDGEVVSACQQSCPTRAIHFGDLADSESDVARSAASSRDYALLAELNIRPRTSFLARVKNPNPELETA
jgi:molybdopterin-containing oxidoreductase family iron-sulfur binding subunit